MLGKGGRMKYVAVLLILFLFAFSEVSASELAGKKELFEDLSIQHTIGKNTIHINLNLHHVREALEAAVKGSEGPYDMTREQCDRLLSEMIKNQLIYNGCAPVSIEPKMSRRNYDYLLGSLGKLRKGKVACNNQKAMDYMLIIKARSVTYLEIEKQVLAVTDDPKAEGYFEIDFSKELPECTIFRQLWGIKN